MVTGLNMASFRKAMFFFLFEELFVEVLVKILMMSSTTNGEEPVVVQTTSGKLEGVRGSHRLVFESAESVTNIVDEFLGIPFAAPPTGDLRFRAPARPRPWSGVRPARSIGPACPQRIYDYANGRNMGEMNEDCLYLNIYSPFLDPDKRRPSGTASSSSSSSSAFPVMVFIHGGSFLGGSGSIYNGTALAMFGVLVVTINYRLDLLGFLSSGSTDLPGNYGLMDQIQALEWIQQNIRSFRGDPSRVTIFGSSAGGASVGLAFLSPLAQGLFHRVIAQSGTANAMWASHTDKTPVELSAEVTFIADTLSCRRKSLQETIECLRLVPWTSLVHNEEMCSGLACSDIDPVVKPVVDGNILPDRPSELLRLWKFNNTIPYMTGTVREEFGSSKHNYSEFSSWKDVDLYLGKTYGETTTNTIAMFYTDWKQQNINPYHLLSETKLYDRAEVLGDLGLQAPTLQMAHDIASAKAKNLFLYYFDLEKSYHSVELSYVFGLPYIGGKVDEYGQEFTSQTSTEVMKRTSSIVMKMWSNFAKYGNPTPSNRLSETGNVRWERFTSASGACLHIKSNLTNLELQMVQHIRADRTALWNVIVPAISSKNCAKRCEIVYDETKTAFLIGCVAALASLLFCLLCLGLCALRHGLLRLDAKRQ